MCGIIEIIGFVGYFTRNKTENMAKVISQETFDDVVQENIVEFEMSAAEAKVESIKQFEAQGINLANIIKDLKINEETGKPILNETIEKLKTIAADVTFSRVNCPIYSKHLRWSAKTVFHIVW